MKPVILLLVLFALGCSDRYYIEHEYHEAGEEFIDSENNLGGMGGMGQHTGWSQSGNLVSLQPNQGPTLQATFPEMGSYTVQFNVQDPPEGIDPVSGLRRIARPRAQLEWKVQGNTLTRLVDVFQGTSLTGPAESVKVRLFDASVATAGPIAPNIPYLGSIQIAKGVRASIFPPTLEAIEFSVGGVVGAPFGRAQIGAGSSALYIIPKGIGIQSFSFNLTPLVPGTGNIALVTVDTSSTFNTKSYESTKGGEFFPLTPGAFQVNIGNNDAVTWLSSVTFGIDG